MVSSLFPQAGSATARRASRAARRVLDGRAVTAAGSITATPRSEPCDGGADPALLALFEDRAQAAQRLAALAPDPAAAGDGLHQAVREQLGLGLGRELDARLPAGRVRQDVLRAQPVAVVLPALADADDPERGRHLD